MTASGLYDAAKELLDYCVVVLDELPAGAPERRYVAFGLPAFDCEQLTVHAFQVGEADVGPNETSMDRFKRGHPYPRVNMAFLVVTIARDCYPGPTGTTEAPAVADLVAASEVLYADGWALWNRLSSALRDGELFEACSLVGWEPLQPTNPDGGIAAWTMGVQVSLDGFS